VSKMKNKIAVYLYLWDEVHSNSDLQQRTKETIMSSLNEEGQKALEPILDTILKGRLLTIANFSMTLDEYIKNVKSIAFQIYGGKDIDDAIKWVRNDIKNGLYRCTPTKQLVYIKNKEYSPGEPATLELIEQLKAVMSSNTVIVHPLLVELAEEKL